MTNKKKNIEATIQFRYKWPFMHKGHYRIHHRALQKHKDFLDCDEMITYDILFEEDEKIAGINKLYSTKLHDCSFYDDFKDGNSG